MLRTECGVKITSQHFKSVTRGVLDRDRYGVVMDTSMYVSVSAHNFIGLGSVWNESHRESLTKFSSEAALARAVNCV